MTDLGGSDEAETGNCNNCGRLLPAGHPVGDYCGECPPHLCDQCGQMDSMKVSCPCWVSVEDLSLADVKGMFARDGLNVASDGMLTR